MQELIDRIKREGIHVGGGIVKLDGFLNHQVDAGLTERMGAEFCTRFGNMLSRPPTKIVTAEVSGIPTALATARLFEVPMLYARKHQSSVMTDVYYFAQTTSRTKGGEVNLLISKHYLGSGDHVLIIDDFLATGSTIRALASIVDASGAELLGIGCVVEKPFEKGRERLADLDVCIETLARIEFDGDKLHVY
ncbi:MAG: xanthine phosphoribosyltransferase [Proteobacteria bacterium]|nr:MAG: xanthine phosphoribosyltransferase [Pseudomonadota bacterium]